MGADKGILMAPGVRAAGEELYRRLQLSLLLRALMVSFLLGATVFIHFTRTPSFLTVPLIALYILSGITFLFTLLSVIALRLRRRLTLFSFIQIVWEILFVTALIWITTTEGIENIFTFLYLLTIIMAGILQYRRGTFLAAASGTILYGLLLTTMKFGYVPLLLPSSFQPQQVKQAELFYNFFINLAAMFGTAVLASYLTEKLRVTGDELKETIRDRDALEVLNDNIVRSLSSGILTLNRDLRISSFNAAAESITGIARDQARGKSFFTLFPEAAPTLAEPANERRHEVVWRTPNGELRYHEFRVSPLRGAEGEILGQLVIFNDITELRQMEQKLRQTDRLAAVGQLAAGIAHEIRNPLAAISGSIQVLDHELDLDPTSRRLMKIVIREADRLNALITDFLLYARPGPRALQLVMLDRLVAEVVEVFQNRTDLPPGLEWRLELDPALELETDPKLLEQILWNLINNAAQAMPQGGRLTLRAARRQADTGAVIRLEVEDTGAGIPVELLDKIFDPFFTTREGGTGLGLGIVYRIVETMDGTVVAGNVAEGGARFAIEVPVRLSDAGAAAAAAEKGNDHG